MNVKTEIDLYNYQKGAIDKIFERFENCPNDYHLLYQLPTGGGKTIIFSEIVRQYLKLKKKKVVVLTHRIELCNQTSKVLSDFGVLNKVVNSKAAAPSLIPDEFPGVTVPSFRNTAFNFSKSDLVSFFLI